MRLEIAFATNNEAECVTVDFIELEKDGNCFNLDWDESNFGTREDGLHHLYARGVYINEEYGNGRIDEIKNAVVSAIQLYNYATEEEEQHAEIVSLEIYDEDKTYAFPKKAFDRVKEIVQEEIEK